MEILAAAVREGQAPALVGDLKLEFAAEDPQLRHSPESLHWRQTLMDSPLRWWTPSV